MKKIILPALMLAVLSSGALHAQTKTDQKKVQPAPAKPAAGKNTLPPPMKAPASSSHAMPMPKPGGTQQVKPATMPAPAAKPTAVKPAPAAKPAEHAKPAAPAKPMPAAKPTAAKPEHAKAAPAAKKHTVAKKHTAPKKKAKVEEIVMPAPPPPPPPMPVITEPTRPAEVEVNKMVERKDADRESSYAHHGHEHGEDFDYHTRRAWRQHYRQMRREMRWSHHTHCGSCCNDKY